MDQVNDKVKHEEEVVGIENSDDENGYEKKFEEEEVENEEQEDAVDDAVNEENGDESDNNDSDNESDFDGGKEEAANELNDENNEAQDVYSLKPQKNSNTSKHTQKKNVRKSRRNETKEPVVVATQAPIDPYSNEDPNTRRRRLLEERMDQAIKTRTVRRKKDEDDLERMQDDKIDDLKDQMIKAANMDVEKNSQGQTATEKMKLLSQVTDILSRADLAISILDNNLLEAVRLWLEPLPDASMPAYQIQKSLIAALDTLPIKTDHLVASGIGKVLVFYQRSKRTEPALKKIVDKLIGDWTRPILNKSDSYKDRSIQFNDYDKHAFTNKLASARSSRPKEAKTLYEQNAARRKRAAIPTARTAAYKIAPRVDPSLIRRQQARNLGTNDERFRRLNSTLSGMGTKKKTKKGGPSIEGRNLAM